MTEEPKAKEAAKSGDEAIIEFINPDPHFKCYSNSAQIVTTFWDFRFNFGEIVRVEKAERKLIIEQQATIVMSPQHAKALASALLRNLEAYEKQFGEIKSPPQEQREQGTAEAESTPRA